MRKSTGPRRIDRTGKRYGKLLVIGPVPKSLWHDEHAEWYVQCDCGWSGVRSSRYLSDTSGCRSCVGVQATAHLTPEQRSANAKKAREAGRLGPEHHQWKGDEITYSAAHARVYRQRGPAKNYPCARCGRFHDRMEWAYNGEDPNELYGKTGNVWPYSTDPAFYVPLCGDQCHIIFDQQRAREREEAAVAASSVDV
jgi:hypothetical protein